ncbi:uncharacterized protein TRAVEDRAFT_30504 [Trametes versicolor FP-101664 SS1]|uniref:uncharacterized protein n=1 Tax=Trametes versicolor (strain FP-101664) TaxID=717944 RepID=UPI0004623F4B|nr:uncharacterized protein TRAVEDRAFT_30504 [Trametes versicolor FP-101664 SS1]EIW55780.1 hypothetical protein TRAVEDRAFT_30504 [Trametes versicolor FP-101664 SS1]
MSLPLASLPLSLDDTYGALLVGTFLGIILYGVSLHQLFRYIRLYPFDVLSIRFLVTSVMVLETLHVVMTMDICYYYLVTHYFQPLVLLEGVWSLQLIPAVTALTACVSKVFLARRVFLTGPRSRWATALVGILLVAELALGIVLSVKGFIIVSLLQYAESTVGILSACEAAAIAADVLLAGTLTVTLWTQGYQRSRQSEFPTTDLFMTYVVKTGLLTGICNLLALILAQVWKQALFYSAVNIITTRFYANTLFAVLNSRELMANGRLEIFANAENTSFNAFAQAHRVAQAQQWNAPYAKSTPNAIKVNVTAEREDYVPDSSRGGSMVFDRKSESLPV